MKRITAGDKPVFEDGFYTNLSMDAYHEDPALSKSGAVDFAQSPLTYKLRRTEPQVKKDHFDLGSLAHSMILEPNEVDNNFVVIPGEVLTKSGARSGNAYKEWCEQEAALRNRTPVLRDQFDLARRLRDNVHENPEHELARILCTGPSEISFFYTDEILNIRKKCRPDCLPGGGIITDLKTTRCAVDWKFGAQAYNLKYHWSSAMSIEICSAITKTMFRDFYFIVVETELPYDVAVYKVEDIQRIMAAEELQAIYDRYKECYEQDIWPGYPKEAQELKFPGYAYKAFWSSRDEDEYF